MALKHSVLTSLTANQASATSVFSSQSNTNTLYHTVTNAGIKIAGVVLLVSICSLIVLATKKSSHQANDAFNAANTDSVSALQSDASAATSVKKNVDESANESSTAEDSATSINHSAATNSSSSSVNVTINGEPAATVSAGSNYSKVVSDPSGITTLTVTNSGNANNTSFSSSNTYVSSNAYSSTSDSGTTFTNNFHAGP